MSLTPSPASPPARLSQYESDQIYRHLIFSALQLSISPARIAAILERNRTPCGRYILTHQTKAQVVAAIPELAELVLGEGGWEAVMPVVQKRVAKEWPDRMPQKRDMGKDEDSQSYRASSPEDTPIVTPEPGSPRCHAGCVPCFTSVSSFADAQR